MNSSSKPPDGLVIPDHHLERRIGRGGYGEIWLARNIIGTWRAVKIVFRSQFDSPKPYEREFAGLKAFEPISRNHPGFVDVLQVGRNDEAGYIYYVMELADDEVSGRIVDPETYSAKTLARIRDRLGRLPAEECLQIGRSLASALGFLHKAALVHRDIKPSNIIFVNGEPKLADIGLVISLSEAHTYVGSDGYIPPEGPGTVQADIYSLGKLLYEISTGQHRDQFPDLPPDIAQFEDSTTISELNQVVLKACENDRDLRYRSADELRADLEMILAGRSVKQLRFIERQLTRVRRLAGAALILAGLAVAFGGVVAYMARQKSQLLAKAYVSSGEQLVEAANAHAAVPLFTAALRLEENDDAAAEAHRLRIGAALAEAPKLLQFWEHGSPVRDVRFSPDGQRVLVTGGRTVRIVEISSGEQRHQFTVTNELHGASFSRDGKRVAVAHGKFVCVFDATSGEQLWQRPQRHSVLSAEFSPDGQRLVLGCSSTCAHLLDAGTGAPIGDLKGHQEDVRYAEFSPDGTLIVTGSRDGTARVWNTQSRETLAVLPHPPWVNHVAFAPDGRRVATCGERDNAVFVWELSERPYVSARMEHGSSVQSVCFSPDGHSLISASVDRTARIWNTRTGKPETPIINLSASAFRAVFSPEGRRVAVAGQGGRVRIWDISQSMPVNVGPGVVSANGERYVTYASNSFRIWNARSDSPLTPLLTVTQEIASVSCSRDARVIALCPPSVRDRSATIYLHGVDSAAMRAFEVPEAKDTVVLSPDGTKLVATNGSSASVWNTATGKLLFDRGDFPGRVEAVVFSPDSRTLALSSSALVFVLDAQTGAERFAPLSNTFRVCSLAFSEDASRLAGTTKAPGFAASTGIVWDARKGTRLSEFAQHSDGVRSAAFASGGAVATAGDDSLVFVWDADTGASRFEWQLAAPSRFVQCSADGGWVTACSWRDAQLWEVRTGRALTPGFHITGPGVFDESGFVAGKRRLWVLSSRGLLFWDLPQATASPDELLALAHYLGTTIPVGLEWDRNALPLSKLRERCAGERARVESTLTAWHAQQARRFEHEEEWFAAGFHLDQLRRRAPDDAELRKRADAVLRHLSKEPGKENIYASPPSSAKLAP